MIRRLALAATLALLPLAVGAQDRKETLADIRAQLSQLGGELSGLRNELMTTGAVARPGGANILERMEGLELELMRLTGRTEELEMKVKNLVADSGNRIDDLEFRVVELEGGDTSSSSAGSSSSSSSSGTTSTPTARPVIGDKPSTAAPASPSGSASAGSGAKADLDRAREVLGQGDFRAAEELLAPHAETYGSGPLTGEVLYLRGEAQEGLGNLREAATLFLESFSSYPEGDFAAAALFRLGRALARLDQFHEGCITLGEVPLRYPNHPAAADATRERQALACP